MTTSEIKKLPIYQMLASMVGDKRALTVVQKKIEEDTLANQAEILTDRKLKTITIPDSMTKLDASKELKRQWDDEENKIEVARSFNTWNWKDLLVAVKKVSEEHFGWIRGKVKVNFFSVQKPQEIDVITDVVKGKKKTETCFYGYFTVSPWEDAEVNVEAGHITVDCKKRYANDVREFFDKIQNHLDSKSIYRGKAITVTKKEDPWGNVSLDFEIFELNTSKLIVLNKDVKDVVENFILDSLGEEGKRCYLFSGGYGNGKTETAMIIGEHGISKGMAFFYCKDAAVFHMLLKQAINYQPCVVFLEDVDEIGSGEQRDADMNRILNTLDGVQTKGNDLTVMFTTNHENRINPALRRPGRIDLVVHFSHPDKKSVAEIYRRYFDKLDTEHALDYEALAEYTPVAPGAVIAEISKRAVRLIAKRGQCTPTLVESAIASMKHHLELMSEPIERQTNGNFTLSVQNAEITRVDEPSYADAKVK